ncbi:hypothetical protein [Kineosporia sp. A_224]|uniref:hypothetical protein n=1 Tax=Kineosporia sp. A_224 TaxID=1962180 RepID=UPI000B4B4BC3|nr:hypothetical protein [Kineosporia sp. A_224]
MSEPRQACPVCADSVAVTPANNLRPHKRAEFTDAGRITHYAWCEASRQNVVDLERRLGDRTPTHPDMTWCSQCRSVVVKPDRHRH